MPLSRCIINQHEQIKMSSLFQYRAEHSYHVLKRGRHRVRIIGSSFAIFNLSLAATTDINALLDKYNLKKTPVAEHATWKTKHHELLPRSKPPTKFLTNMQEPCICKTTSRANQKKQTRKDIINQNKQARRNEHTARKKLRNPKNFDIEKRRRE